jgi:Mn-dependent DtxR family transcriptional regulator
MGDTDDLASLEGVLILYKSLSVSNNWSPLYRMMISILITFSGLSQFDRDGIRLTKKGLSLARERVRSHQLWEAYLSEHAELPESHLDLSADYVEHFISSDILSKLEKNLEEPAMPEGKKQTQREEV